MITTMSRQAYFAMYYEMAMKSAQYHLNTLKSEASYWDKRIDEKSVMLEAVTNAIEKSYDTYDPNRGTKVSTLLLTIVYHELVNELKKETRSLASLGEVTSNQEREYTFKSMVERIPEDAFGNLSARLRQAISELSPIDQAILQIYINNPKTYIEEAVKELGVSENFVSVHKSRALSKLPALMGVSKSEYYDLKERSISFGFIQATPPVPENPVYPQFDLGSTVAKLYDIVVDLLKR